MSVSVPAGAGQLPGEALYRMADAPAADLRVVLDGLDDVLVVVGLDYRIQQANRAAQRRSHEGGEILGRSCRDVFHCGRPCDSPDCECPVPTVLATGDAVKVTHIHDGCGDEPARHVQVVASPLRDAAGRIIAVIESMRDVTEERQLEEALVRRHEQLSILNRVAQTVNLSLDLPEILGRALDEVLHLTGVDVGAIFLREDALGSLQLLAHRGLSEEAARVAAQFGLLDSACGGVIEAQRIIIVPDLSRYRGRRAESLRREQLSTLVHIPLIVKGASLGSMCVGTRRVREFDATEQDLLSAIGAQIAVAIENARLYTEVQRKEHLRGELLRKVISAQEEERKRIARELHDDTSQALTALLYAAEEAMDVQQNAAETSALLQAMRKLAQRTLDGVHKLIFDLRPTMLDHLGLVPAIRWFAQSRLEPAGVRVAFDEGSLPRRLPAETETALFRVVQEAITNIGRHAMARNVYLSFQAENGVAAIGIEDDGVGFDLVEATFAPDSGRGLGLMGMRERVELLGGELDLDSAPGYGTRITIRVPTK